MMANGDTSETRWYNDNSSRYMSRRERNFFMAKHTRFWLIAYSFVSSPLDLVDDWVYPCLRSAMTPTGEYLEKYFARLRVMASRNPDGWVPGRHIAGKLGG